MVVPNQTTDFRKTGKRTLTPNMGNDRVRRFVNKALSCIMGG
jgi:hypothetical protein